MHIAPLPANEEQRLAALHRLLILDTPPDARFDRIVRFAASEFELPMAAISLIDARRQWFKARLGLAACETPRDTSFCSHALLERDLMVISDATADWRFYDNPCVAGEPYVRFYAGAPLRLRGGETLGTLCVIDSRPREFDKFECAILRTLRDLVVGELLQGPRKSASHTDALASTMALRALLAPAGNRE